ncbi:MAG TPA: patatin-like phospholipase family protein [Mycobacteriales bacterium]|jgi:NTE family protein|nr:patatin-like phospholipase family protein [Mycobacteriales bacterium]
MAVPRFLRRRRRGSEELPALTPPPPTPPREVVVFSGGGSLGAAQVGAIQALFEAGIVPDAVVGCSVGAINAAYVAMDPTADRMAALEAVWRSMSRREVFPGGRFRVARRIAARSNFLYPPDGMRAVFAQCVPLTDLAQTAIPCHVVTTDLIAGEPTWWTSGDPVDLLNASACLPGLFPPVRLEGRLHVDGGVSCPVPIQRALDLGASRVWVLNVARDFHGWSSDRMSALDVLLESFAISRSHLGRLAPVPAPGQQVVSLPPLSIGRHDMRNFSQTPRLVAAGREAGRAMVAEELRARVRRPLEPAAADPHVADALA